MEIHLPNKFLHVHQQSHVTLRYETNRRTDLVHSIYTQL